ncbi:MAG: hypothetical protein HFG44_01145 [Oscillospiraceae bacterium]|nr:hypothetical protein [Oscillospiraceae bacterium]
MLIAMIGESCVGKTTLANALKEAYGAQIFSGKDYLRLAKNEGEAKKLFQEKLKAAVDGETILYLIAEKEQLSLLPEGAVRILVTADLALIQERFAARMGGKLPAPVAAMLEKKHGCFDKEPFDLHIHNGFPDAAEVCRRLTSGM